MLSKTILPAVAALAGLVAANGHVSITNTCDYDIHVIANGGSPFIIESNGGKYSDPPYSDTTNGIIKMSKSDNFASGNILQIEWAATDFVYYDMSEIDGDPFGNNFKLVPSDSTCTTSDDSNAYHVDGPHGTLACSKQANLHFTPC